MKKKNILLRYPSFTIFAVLAVLVILVSVFAPVICGDRSPTAGTKWAVTCLPA